MGVNKVLARLVDERERLHTSIDEVLDGAGEEDRDPSEAEKDLLTRHKARLDQLEPQIVQLAELEERRRDATDARALVRSRRETPEGDEGDEGGDENGEGEGGDEGAKYRTFAQYARDELLVRFDKIGHLAGPGVRQRAAGRLARAVPKVLTSDVPGLLPPQYIAQIMQVIDKSRPIVDAGRTINLSAGKIQYPRITNRPEVGVQATEKTEAGDGAMDVIMVEKVAKTFLAAANFSWQTIQWSNPDALALWFDLAAESYAQKTEADAAALLTIAGGLDSPPVVVESNDLAGWMAAIAAAAGAIYTATGRRADTIAMSPDVGFPLLGLVGATTPTFLATGSADLSTGAYPSLGGLRYVISNGLPAASVVVGDFDALLCAETAGSPVELRAVEPSIGGFEVGIIGAFLSELIEEAAFVPLTAPVVTP